MKKQIESAAYYPETNSTRVYFTDGTFEAYGGNVVDEKLAATAALVEEAPFFPSVDTAGTAIAPIDTELGASDSQTIPEDNVLPIEDETPDIIIDANPITHGTGN